MNRLFIPLGVLILVLAIVPYLQAQDDEVPKNCRNVDLSAFCILDNHFKKIVNERLEWNYYPQFQEIVDDVFHEDPWVDDDQDKGFTPDQVQGIAIDPGTTTNATGAGNGSSTPSPGPANNRTGRANASIYTYNDMCDLHQMLFLSSSSAGGPKQFSQNPYKLEVTEITVKGNRLHNHLHLRIYNDHGNADSTGKIRYAFIVVHDQNGWAVGDFNTGVRCHDDCACDPATCHQGNFNDTIPCMFTSLKSVTHPGMMMLYGGEAGVEEIHATWRFAQSTSKGHFIKQLHFKTLLMEDNETRTMERDCRVNYRFTNMYPPNSSEQCTKLQKNVLCTPVPRTGKWGWTAQYKILWPTMETLGAWDYYPRKFIKESDVVCHAAVSSDHYFEEEYPKYDFLTEDELSQYDVNKTAPNSCGFDYRYKFPRNGEKGSGPRFITGALNSLYSKLTWEEETKLFYGAIQEEYLKEQQIFLHDEYNHRVPYSGGGVKPPKLNKKLDGLTKLTNMQKDERCRCPRMGALPPGASKRAPPVSQLEGRKDHAIQMTIAWIVLVPFAVFASRYYKETYSKVFFLQEYWWYTMHVLSLFLAAMFMVGGIYAIEIKREERFNDEDPGQVIHAIIGGVALILFLVQLILGWTRMKKPEHRRIQIFLHWLFGVIEYSLALITMLNASIIFAGCMSCYNFCFVIGWLVIQLIFYIVMEVHMRKVDKKLKLDPKRSYLPPPVMRVFHESAPGAKFRIYMLIAYFVACVIAYGVMHYYIEFTSAYRSCFNYDEDFERIIMQFHPD